MFDKIYTIMVSSRLEKDEETGFPTLGSSRIVGYYTSKEDAFEAVVNNYCDIWEFCYDYAVIEEIEEGLYRPAPHEGRWFFKHDQTSDKYELIDEPEFMEHFVGLTIG